MANKFRYNSCSFASYKPKDVLLDDGIGVNSVFAIQDWLYPNAEKFDREAYGASMTTHDHSGQAWLRKVFEHAALVGSEALGRGHINENTNAVIDIGAGCRHYSTYGPDESLWYKYSILSIAPILTEADHDRKIRRADDIIKYREAEDLVDKHNSRPNDRDRAVGHRDRGIRIMKHWRRVMHTSGNRVNGGINGVMADTIQRFIHSAFGFNPLYQDRALMQSENWDQFDALDLDADGWTAHRATNVRLIAVDSAYYDGVLDFMYSAQQYWTPTWLGMGEDTEFGCTGYFTSHVFSPLNVTLNVLSREYELFEGEAKVRVQYENGMDRVTMQVRGNVFPYSHRSPVELWNRSYRVIQHGEIYIQIQRVAMVATSRHSFYALYKVTKSIQYRELMEGIPWLTDNEYCSRIWERFSINIMPSLRGTQIERGEYATFGRGTNVIINNFSEEHVQPNTAIHNIMRSSSHRLSENEARSAFQMKIRERERTQYQGRAAGIVNDFTCGNYWYVWWTAAIQWWWYLDFFLYWLIIPLVIVLLERNGRQVTIAIRYLADSIGAPAPVLQFFACLLVLIVIRRELMNGARDQISWFATIVSNANSSSGSNPEG